MILGHKNGIGSSSVKLHEYNQTIEGLKMFMNHCQAFDAVHISSDQNYSINYYT